MSVKVYSPKSGIQVRLKGEDANDDTKTVETEATTTTSNVWETLVFDFNNVAEGTNPFDPSSTFNKFSIFFDFGNNGDDAVYYWDDVKFGSDEAALASIKSMNNLNVYPNPTTGLLLIDAQNASMVSVYNMVGQLKYETALNAGSISIENLESGVYFVKVNNQLAKVVKR